METENRIGSLRGHDNNLISRFKTTLSLSLSRQEFDHASLEIHDKEHTPPSQNWVVQRHAWEEGCAGITLKEPDDRSLFERSADNEWRLNDERKTKREPANINRIELLRV